MLSNFSPKYYRIVALAFLLIQPFAKDGHAQVPLTADSLNRLLEVHQQRDTNRIWVLNQLAFANYYNSPISSLQHGFEAQKIADSLGYVKGEAEAFRQIGLAFWAQSDMLTAINYFLTGLRIAEQNGLKQTEADILSNIGTAYNGMNQPKEALNFLIRSRQLQQTLKNRWREASVMNNIGDAYLALNEFEKANEAYSFALNVSKREKYFLGVSTNLRNLGNVLEKRGRLDSALVNYKQCVELSGNLKDNRGIILSNRSLASVYIKQNKLSLAEEHASLALQVAIGANLRAFMRDLYELLARIKELQGDERSAFRYYKLFTAYKDSVQNLITVTEVAGKRLRFETEKKQTEIELLKKDAELKSSLLKSRNYLLVFSSLSLLLALSLLWMSFRNYKKIRYKNKQLSDKNGEISYQHKKLSELNDELVAVNEELRSQQEEVLLQRDELESKNTQIERMHDKVLEINENLESMVLERTTALQIQNKILRDYAFINAHKLRAPLASIMGIVALMQHSKSIEEQAELTNYLHQSAEELDRVVRSINDTIERGLSVHEDDQPDLN